MSQQQPNGPNMEARQQEDQRIQESLGKIKHTILVMSGKGGVGKSTVAVNLAVALQHAGQKVGLMDVDLHGPTVPVLLGLTKARPAVLGDKLIPMAHTSGLAMVSIGNLLDIDDRAVIWRGPKKIGAIRQFIGDVEWGELDYLIIDSPPGTGDEPLTIAQTIPHAQALIVTTPQEVSLADVRKSINFCQTVEMPILGIIENMSGFLCPSCGHVEPIFGAGGGGELARKLQLRFLGAVPIDPNIVRGGDKGLVFVEEADGSSAAHAFTAIIAEVQQNIGEPAAPAGGETKADAEPEPTDAAPTDAAPTDAAPAAGEVVVVVPTHGGSLTNHFGHADAMTFFTVRDGAIVDEKVLTPPDHSPGVLPPWVAEQGGTVIIAGGMGSRAQEMFRNSGVQVMVGAPAIEARAVVEQFLSGTLATGSNVCDH
ncbi:MAG: iron-sulfur cluster carrier protein MrpORP [Candidatus Lernaella stagnicola]|nr:iron-sulfur cluster carrier protein MrpORP [Candidatus Lernaella stagnicola]